MGGFSHDVKAGAQKKNKIQETFSVVTLFLFFYCEHCSGRVNILESGNHWGCTNWPCTAVKSFKLSFFPIQSEVIQSNVICVRLCLPASVYRAVHILVSVRVIVWRFLMLITRPLMPRLTIYVHDGRERGELLLKKAKQWFVNSQNKHHGGFSFSKVLLVLVVRHNRILV